jgi:hypothetical protein
VNPLNLDRFDYDTYWRLLDRLSSDRAPIRMADLLTAEWPERFFILRHDVDYSPSAALELARQEADRGIRATYFILLQNFYYNPLAPDWASFPGSLSDLGHEVGLHYDARALTCFPLAEAQEILRGEAALLGRISGFSVRSLAPHQPALGPADRFLELEGFVNAMDARFCVDIPYYSDSCRAWRDETWAALTGETPGRFQLGLHPINWGPIDRSRDEIFAGMHRDLIGIVQRTGDELLAAIREHEGVRQHERRAKDAT